MSQQLGQEGLGVRVVAGGSQSRNGAAGELAVHPGRLGQSPGSFGKRVVVSMRGGW